MKLLSGFIAVVDSINEFAGTIANLFSYMLFVVVVVGVIARKVFNHPFIWNFEASYMLYAAMFLFGLGYTLKHKMHVTVDVFYTMAGPKTRFILDLIGFLLFLVPFGYVSLKSTFIFAQQSWQILEHSQSTWAPPIYPFKSLMPLAFLLLVLQAVVEIIRSYYSNWKGIEIDGK